MAHDTTISADSPGFSRTRILLACGLAAPVLKIGVDLAAVAVSEGYDLARMSISDLSAVGAQTRWFVLPVDLVAHALLLAFALGVWRSGGRSRKSRLFASLILGNAVFLLAGAFFPFRLGEPLDSSANVLNTVVIGVSVLFLMLAVIAGAITQHGWFRYCSIVTLVVFLVGDVWATRNTPFVLAGQRGEFVGVQERTMLYAYLAWVLILGLRMLYRGEELPKRSGRGHNRGLHE